MRTSLRTPTLQLPSDVDREARNAEVDRQRSPEAKAERLALLNQAQQARAAEFARWKALRQQVADRCRDRRVTVGNALAQADLEAALAAQSDLLVAEALLREVDAAIKQHFPPVSPAVYATL